MGSEMCIRDRRAISNAKDAELYRKLSAEQRHEAPPQASTKFTV